MVVASVVAAQDKPRLGVGLKISTLGLGVEAATDEPDLQHKFPGISCLCRLNNFRPRYLRVLRSVTLVV